MMLSTYVSNQTIVKEQFQNNVSQLIQIIGGSLLIALCSQIKIILPFTIVPFTLQTLAVLFLGGLFGSKKGTLMVLTYLAESMMGMPVLAGGTINSMALIGPKAGYLMGFVIQAYWMGLITEKMSNFSSKTLIVAATTACLLQLMLGVCCLSYFVGWETAWIMGFCPFILGEFFKVLIAVSFLKRYRFSNEKNA